jgi:hypothetical protein
MSYDELWIIGAHDQSLPVSFSRASIKRVIRSDKLITSVSLSSRKNATLALSLDVANIGDISRERVNILCY